jgi:hypothetical protein
VAKLLEMMESGKIMLSTARFFCREKIKIGLIEV